MATPDTLEATAPSSFEGSLPSSHKTVLQLSKNNKRAGFKFPGKLPAPYNLAIFLEIWGAGIRSR